jgi:hypothetical protein
MNLKNTLWLIICLLWIGGSGILFIQVAVKNEIVFMYGGFYFSLFICSLMYLAGIKSAIPKEKRQDHKLKAFYFYPLLLHLLSNLVYSYLGITFVMEKLKPADPLYPMILLFATSLGSYIMFYVAGMVITKRHVNNQELYFTMDSFMMSVFYAVPSVFISLLTIYLLINSDIGLYISSIIALAISVQFCYFGISAAAGSNPKKPAKYKFLILSIYLMYVAGACVITPLVVIPFFRGEFLPMWMAYISTVIYFMTIFPVCVMISGYVYRPEP